MNKHLFCRLLMVSMLSSLIWSCKKEDNLNIDTPAAVSGEAYSLSFVNLAERATILDDNTSRDSLYKFTFRVNNLISLQMDTTGRFSLQNVAVAPIRELGILMTLKDGTSCTIVKLDSMSALSRASAKVELINKAFQTSDNKTLILSSPAQLSGAKFSLTSTDSLFTKLKNITVPWEIKTSIRGGGSWYDMNPLHVREYIALFTNMAYLFSQDDMEQAFLSSEVFTDNNKTPITKVVRQELWNRITTWKTFTTGLVGEGASGLGGGTVLGLRQYMIFRQYIPNSNFTTFFHEMGHCLGYSHDSNMTYPSGDPQVGFAVVGPQQYFKLLSARKLPFWDYRMLNTWAKYINQPEGTYLYEKTFKSPTFPVYQQ